MTRNDNYTPLFPASAHILPRLASLQEIGWARSGHAFRADDRFRARVVHPCPDRILGLPRLRNNRK